MSKRLIDEDQIQVKDVKFEELEGIINQFPLNSFTNLEMMRIASTLYNFLEEGLQSQILEECLRRLSKDEQFIRQPEPYEYKYRIGQILEKRRTFYHPKTIFIQWEVWETVKVLGYVQSDRFPRYRLKDINDRYIYNHGVYESELRLPVNPNID